MLHILGINDDFSYGIVRPGTHLATQVRRCRQFGDFNTFRNIIGTFMNQDTVAWLNFLYRLGNRQQRSGFRSIVSIITCGSHMDVCG